MSLKIFYQNVSMDCKFSGDSFVGILLGRFVWDIERYKKLLYVLNMLQKRYSRKNLPREVFAGLVCLYNDISLVNLREICVDSDWDEICDQHQIMENLLADIVQGEKFENLVEWDSVVSEFKTLCENVTLLREYVEESFVGGLLEFGEWDDESCWILERDLVRLLRKKALKREEMVAVFSIVRVVNLFVSEKECSVKHGAKQFERCEWLVSASEPSIYDRFRRLKILLNYVASGDERFFKMEFYYKPPLKTSSV